MVAHLNLCSSKISMFQIYDFSFRYTYNKHILWRKQKVRLPQIRFPSGKGREVRLLKHTTNTIELKRTTEVKDVK